MVTGGAGYIGSHAVLDLLERDRVIVVDNLCTGHRRLVPDHPNVRFVRADISDRAALRPVFEEERVDAVMHFSAHAYVGESVTDPAKYYRNNVGATLALLETMLEANVKQFVFSSTCSTFGHGSGKPIDEDTPQLPINPYGFSKLMVEQILRDFDQAYGLKSVVLRYFNAAGADPRGRAGELHDPETHVIPLVLQAALGLRPSFSIYGTDYPTSDGTCVRDYIHVVDISQAHLLALEFLAREGKSQSFNLGNGAGFSVREVIACAEDVAGAKIAIREAPRRPGDPAVLVADARRAKEVLGWRPAYSALELMIRHACDWLAREPGGR
ncbi:MAG: UDP-glucose 4-epimerase GalE [Deltaproteobacteria bacterium]|nr:UDP-glucose 4-epimerase GalE [Deltaproteobacteria bacterium]